MSANYMGFRKNDRIEPSSLLPDVGSMWALDIVSMVSRLPIIGAYNDQQRPSRVLVWRRAQETAVRRNNPFFSREVSLPDVLAIDAMHLLPLGVFHQYVAHTIQHVLQCNVAESTKTQVAERDADNLSYLDHCLQGYNHSVKHDTKTVAKNQLKATAFGTRNAPMCHFKAGETIALVRWLAHPSYGLANVRRRLVRANVFMEGAKLLASLWNAWQIRTWQVSAEALQDILWTYKVAGASKFNLFWNVK
eukprot:1920799-Amphidinium_carterae.2